MTARTVGTPATYLGTGADVFNCHVRTSLSNLTAYQNMDGRTDRTDFVPGEALLFRALPSAKYT